MGSRPATGTSYVLAKVYGVSDQKEFSNLFWYSVFSGSLTPWIDGQVVASTIFTSLATLWADCLPDSIKLRGCDAELSDGSVSISSPFYDDVPGTLVDDDFLPGEVSVIVQKTTATAGKVGRGRWYFSCVPESLTNGSYLTTTGLGAYNALATAAHADVSLTAHSGPLVLRPVHFSPKNTALYTLTATIAVGLMGTKRRRRGIF